jgi:very-short-patch-repair endonuclease
VAVDPEVDRRIRRIAARQDGQISMAQLRAAGLTRAGLQARLEREFLVRTGRGVYGLGHAPQAPRAAERAALLELGPAAWLTHATAAALRSLVPRAPACVEVTLVGCHRRTRSGLIIHRTKALHPADRSMVWGLRTTAPARTLIDLAGEVSRVELADALDGARARRMITDEQLAQAMARAPNRKGVAAMKALLSADTETGFTRSEAERLLRRLIGEARLPSPLMNVALLGTEVDALWPQHKLVVEVDGWEFHRDRMHFESDRRRDRLLIAAGYRVIRVTWRQLVHEPTAVAASIASALAFAATAA